MELVGVVLLVAGVVSYASWRLERGSAAQTLEIFMTWWRPAPRYLTNLPLVLLPAVISMAAVALRPEDPRLLTPLVVGIVALTLTAVWFGVHPPAILLPASRREQAPAPMTRADFAVTVMLVVYVVFFAVIALLLLRRA